MNNDLYLEKILRAAAATTSVKILHKRNVNSDTLNSSDIDDNVVNGYDDNDVFSQTRYATTPANNLSATITSIRSNVTKVLYMYFRNQTTANDSRQNIEHVTTEFQNYDDNLTQLSTYEGPLATASSTFTTIPTMTSEYIENSTYNNSSSVMNHIVNASIAATTTPLNANSNNVIQTTMTHLNKFLNKATTMPCNTTIEATIATNSTIKPSITYPSIAINSYENCSALFANYSQPQQGELNNIK